MKQTTPPPEPIRGENEELLRALTFGLEVKFGGDISTMPAGERLLLSALRLFYANRHNGYVLAEAQDICVRNKVNPPTWVLIAINEGFQRFKDGGCDPKKLAPTLHMGKEDLREYNQYREQQPLMAKVRERINKKPKEGLKEACRRVSNRMKPDNRIDPDTLEKQYTRFWRDFYDFVKGE
jgi:hypothetical protein